MSGKSMLDLDSKQWSRLTHAYGSASDIPKLLDQLKTARPLERAGWRGEPWFSLWSALCHQNDVYTASYAAVPHVVAIATARPPRERVDFVYIVAWIEVCRQSTTARVIPAGLKAAYFEALQSAVPLILECLSLDWDEDAYRVLLGGLAVLQGKPRVGAAIIDPPEEYECPECCTLFPAPEHESFRG